MSTRRLRRALDPGHGNVDQLGDEWEREEVVEEEERRINPFDALMEDTEEVDTEDEAEADQTSHGNTAESIDEIVKNVEKSEVRKKTLQTEEDAWREILRADSQEDKEVEAHEAEMKKDVNYLFETRVAMFNPEKEMAKKFGYKVTAPEVEPLSRITRARQRHNQSIKKTVLVQRKDSWPPLSPSEFKDFQIVPSDDESKGDCKLFTTRLSEEYQRQQHEFETCVSTLDPQSIAFMVQRYPFHIDALLQLSEIYKQHGEFQAASDLVERAVYRIECGLSPMFSITDGRSRVLYRESKSLFLTLFRHIQYLGRRGCVRTALEFSKLLLSLDPVADPTGVLFHLDYFSIRSKEYAYLLDFCEQFRLMLPSEHSDSQDSFCSRLLPNLAYSCALSQFFLEIECQEAVTFANSLEDPSLLDLDSCRGLNASHLFLQAVLLHPEVVVPLLNSAGDGGKFPRATLDDISRCPLFSTAPETTMGRMRDVFVERNAALWSSPPVLEWFASVLSAVLNSVDKAQQVAKTLQAYRGPLFSRPDLGYSRLNPSDFSNSVTLLPEEEDAAVRRPDEPNPIQGTHPLAAFLLSFLPWYPSPNPAEQ